MFFMCIHIIDIYIYACLYIQISYLYIYTHYILIAMPPCRHHICFDFSVCAGGGRYMRLCRAKWQLGMYYKIYIICIYVYLSFHC